MHAFRVILGFICALVPAVTPVASARAQESTSYAVISPGLSASLTGVRHQQQTFNNCGPATISMQLSYFGRTENQADIARVLRPDRNDRNVSPDELVSYAQSLGLRAKWLMGGDILMLRTLVANGLPVIVESWFIPDPNDEMGHYLLLTGYDGDVLTFQDSYHGPNVTETVNEFDPLWKVFNRSAVVVWPPEREAQVQAILGERMDDGFMVERAMATARIEAHNNPQDKYAWFNIGTNLLLMGDASGAAQAYDTAESLALPWRMLWYQFGPYAAYYHAGRYDKVVQLANKTLTRVKNLEESYYWRGMAYAAQGKRASATRDLQRAVALNPNYAQARQALQQTAS
jgi:tetratricopeptide (TPR) repeat protein